MSLRVIGAGFGRTGTLSLKFALEMLGVGPCYHMMEVLQRPGHSASWHAAARGEAVDWPEIFDGYVSAVDWPVCAFWRELAVEYPQAKVILSRRDPQKWYDSVARTIWPAITSEPSEDPEAMAHRAMVQRLIRDDTFDNRFEDRDHAIEVFERHNAAVIETLPPERLLIYEPGQGWAPLCGFLGVEAPDADYPHVNSTEDFQTRFGPGARGSADRGSAGRGRET